MSVVRCGNHLPADHPASYIPQRPTEGSILGGIGGILPEDQS